MLDLPEIHSFVEPRSEAFFNVLSRVGEITIFSNVVIKALIDLKWPLVKEYTVKILFFPFVIYLACFVAFSNVFNGQLIGETEEENQKIRLAKFILIIILYVLSGFSLCNEVVQVYQQRKEYFYSVWNFLDLIVPICNIVIISYHLKEMTDSKYKRPDFIYTIHILSSYLMWLKLFYFLRIFKSTGNLFIVIISLGYLIRMLNQVLYDMKIFLLILIIMYLGFGEAFLRLSEGNAND